MIHDYLFSNDFWDFGKWSLNRGRLLDTGLLINTGLTVIIWPYLQYCPSTGFCTTCISWTSRSFPGASQCINKKIQDPKVVNFTSIFLRTRYLKKKWSKKVFFNPQLRLVDKFKEFSRSWCQNWIFKEFSRALEKNFKNPGVFQEFQE